MVKQILNIFYCCEIIVCNFNLTKNYNAEYQE